MKKVILILFIAFAGNLFSQGAEYARLTEKDILKMIPILTAEARNILTVNQKNNVKSSDKNIVEEIEKGKTDPKEFLAKKSALMFVPAGYKYNKNVSVIVTLQLNTPTAVFEFNEDDINLKIPNDTIDLKTIGTLKELENNDDYKEKLKSFEDEERMFKDKGFIPLNTYMTPDNKLNAGIIDNSTGLINIKGFNYKGLLLYYSDNEYNEKTKGVYPISVEVKNQLMKQKFTLEKYDVMKRALLIARNDSRDLSMLELPGGGMDSEFMKLLNTRKENAKIYNKYSNILDSIFEVILSNNY